ncbi:MAG: 16S rRNA (guanine(527)-N(7))-methyltransferase RsmG [Thermoleophilaceae bacterium]
MTVSRETIARLALRHGLRPPADERLARLLDALAAEPDPPTTVREPAQAADVHLADSLSGLAVEGLRGAARLADLGSGAGFPGLPLAIALPDARVHLLESSRRKCELIERLAGAAEIPNAATVPARVEEWAAAPPPDGGREAYDAVTARALAELAVLAEYASPLLAKDGLLVAWKGARDEREERRGREAAAETGLELEDVLRVQPFERAENRHLYVLRKRGPTPARLPRRPGMATKRPLGKD